ncbi:succinate CoA transferase [Corynebacterium sp. H78]|uniref:succinate CoA transferase n=1 Tax=Corynebacterium sp. H78 TaxID=3133417 RepID=UPI0030AC5456
MSDRIANSALRAKVTTPEAAAEFVKHGDRVGISGFTGFACPKELPGAIATRAKEHQERGEAFQIDLLTGASISATCDGVLAEANAIRFRMPYQGEPTMRKSVNAGSMLYDDVHLSHSAKQISEGYFGEIDVAIVEALRITEEGHIVPSSGIGNSVELLDAAKSIILEVNEWPSLDLEGMADIYRIGTSPGRQPIPITSTGDRIGTTYIDIDVSKVVAVVKTNGPDSNGPFKPFDEISEKIAGFYLDFLEGEVAAGRLSYDNYVMQSGVGNVPNAVMAGLLESKFENIHAYTELIQDGMIDLIDAGKMEVASATAFGLSAEYAERLNRDAAKYRDKIILRPLQVSNHPEVIRRLDVVAANGMLEADIYGNVNSTHIAGSRIMNGIGGSGDFTRNSYISSFITTSEAMGGKISAVVPMVSHHDHTEHDVMVVVSEYGYADLRGLAPRERVAKMISIAHPDYRPMLEEYYERALKATPFMQTPHDLETAFDFHKRFLSEGSMKGK